MLALLPTSTDRTLTDEIEFDILPLATSGAARTDRAEMNFKFDEEIGALNMPLSTQLAINGMGFDIQHEDELLEAPMSLVDARRTELKKAMLEVLHRRKKEHLRSGFLMTVVHPDFSAEEQVPYLIESGETPQIIIQRATRELHGEIKTVAHLFPMLRDANNAIGSSFGRSETESLFF